MFSDDSASIVLAGVKKVQYVFISKRIGVRAPSDLGGGDSLARKIYAMPEDEIVEIGVQTHSNCMKNKNVHNSHI